MTTAIYTPPRTLGDLIPRTSSKVTAAAINVGLMLSFALFTAAMAQFEWRLDFTPVPVTGQTLAVLLSGGVLGWKMGAGSQIMYVLMGLVFPFYSGGAHGYTENKTVGEELIRGTASTFGYLVGFIFAAALVGYFSEKGNDRKVLSSIGSFLLGSVVIYTFGAIWLSHVAEIPIFKGPDSGMTYGVYPFLLGDLMKVALAGALLPGCWALVEKVKPEKPEPSES